MRRSLTTKECYNILSNNYIGNLGYLYRNRPFIVPITFFYDKKQACIISYSAEGHKVKAMRKNNSICLEVAEIESVDHWRSILVHGSFQQLEGSEAKAYLHEFSLGVKDLIFEKEGRDLDFISQFSSKIYNDEIAVIYKLKIEEITGKIRS